MRLAHAPTIAAVEEDLAVDEEKVAVADMAVADMVAEKVAVEEDMAEEDMVVVEEAEGVTDKNEMKP